jgi:hypothetical protein
MMQKFWSLVEESVITQSVVTLVLIGTVCTLWILQRVVPTELIQLTFAVVGFWFGSKVGFKQGANSGGA